MPVYEYTCTACDEQFEKLVRSMSSTDDAQTIECPKCGSKKTARSLSVFAVAADTKQSSPVPSSGMCGCGKVPGSCGMG